MTVYFPSESNYYAGHSERSYTTASVWEDQDSCRAAFGFPLYLHIAKLFMTMIFPSHPIPGL